MSLDDMIKEDRSSRNSGNGAGNGGGAGGKERRGREKKKTSPYSRPDSRPGGGRARGGGRGNEENGAPVPAKEEVVYVGNLTWGTDWRALKDHMKQAGAVVRADVVSSASGRSRGYGTVEYASASVAKKAIESLNGTDLDGREIIVREDRGRDNRRVRKEDKEGDKAEEDPVSAHIVACGALTPRFRHILASKGRESRVTRQRRSP